FFSSRRRHTRFSRDWSSDVCSSDLVVAETGEQAREKLRDYQRLVSVPGAFALFGGWTGVDLAEFEPDEPLRYVESDANRSALASFTTADPDRTWTPRELGRWIGLGCRGPVVTGSQRYVADEQEWGEEENEVTGHNCGLVSQ